jgi:hypothetical protein
MFFGKAVAVSPSASAKKTKSNDQMDVELYAQQGFSFWNLIFSSPSNLKTNSVIKEELRDEEPVPDANTSPTKLAPKREPLQHYARERQPDLAAFATRPDRGTVQLDEFKRMFFLLFDSFSSIRFEQSRAK